MKIKAYAIKSKGGKAEPFSYERKLGKRDVLVKITHRSITKGDVQIINDDWGDTKFPVVCDCSCNHQLPGNKSSNSKPGEELDNGVTFKIIIIKPFSDA